MKIGSHVKMKEPDFIKGSILEGLSYNATCVMLYTGAPQNTIRKNIEDLKIEEAKSLSSMEIVIHAPYIVNLANPEKNEFSVDFLTKEINRSAKIGAKQMVLHPGSATSVSKEEAIRLIGDGINKIIDNTKDLDVKIALETMAGKGNEIGRCFEEIKAIIDLVDNKERVSVCFDTCHVFDSGYDLVTKYDEVFAQFDDVIGLDRISCFHINDSKNTIGSHKDRHENIGKGNIGFEALHKLCHDERFIDIPKILETPYIDNLPPYKEEIEKLKAWLFLNIFPLCAYIFSRA